MPQIEFKFPVGLEVKDNLTDFTGIIESCCHDITGCNRYLVTPKAKGNDAEKAKSLWVHEHSIIPLAKKPKIKEVPAGPSAG